MNQDAQQTNPQQQRSEDSKLSERQKVTRIVHSEVCFAGTTRRKS